MILTFREADGITGDRLTLGESAIPDGSYLKRDGRYIKGDAGISGAVTHNLTTGKQGGQANQYYHLTAAEYGGNWGVKNLVTTGYVSGSQIYVANYINHIGDANTYLYFLPDRIMAYVGGKYLLDMNTVAVQDYVLLGDGSDVDIDLNGYVLVEGNTGKLYHTGGTFNFDNDHLTTTGVITGNSLITAQNIGIAADSDLIQLTGANTVLVNGSLELRRSDAHPILKIAGVHATDYDPTIAFYANDPATERAKIYLDATDDRLILDMAYGGGIALTINRPGVIIGDFATCTASAHYTIAAGLNCDCTANFAQAYGYDNTASAISAMCFGRANTVSFYAGVAIGYNNTVSTANYGVAIGTGNAVASTSGVGIGNACDVQGSNAVGIGLQAKPYGTAMICAGYRTKSSATYGMVFGCGTLLASYDFNTLAEKSIVFASAETVTRVIIANTKADGDPVLQWALTQTVKASLGIDDTDDLLKLGSTAIGTNTTMIWDIANQNVIMENGDFKIASDTNGLVLGAGQDSGLRDSGSAMVMDYDLLNVGGRSLIVKANAVTQMTFDGDLFFTGDGVGLPYGSCHGYHIAWAQAAAQNTWYNVSDADIVDGKLNTVTHDGSGKLTVTKAGIYKAIVSLDLESDAANKHIEIGFEKNGSGTAETEGIVCVEIAGANNEYIIGTHGDLDLAANDTVELCVRTIDAGNPTLTIDCINLSLVHIGGT